METKNLNIMINKYIIESETDPSDLDQTPESESLLSSEAVAIARRTNVNWLMMIYFVSGICSLMDEVIWVRLLKLTLGNTVYATSIVVSTFMGGLAIGSFIMSRYSDRITKRLQLYALLETLITISALSLPWGLKVVDKLYIWFYRTYNPANRELLIVQIIASGLILLVPSILMGSTLPLLGRYVTSLEKQTGHLVGRLYALNTFGAAVGCFLAGFVLIRSIGVMGTLYTAAILNLFVASAGYFLSRFAGVYAEEETEDVPIEIVEIVSAKLTNSKFYVLLIGFFLSGLISIGYELLWMRSIVHLLSGYTYVFSSVLTIYLLGNVIGAAIGSGLVRTLKIPAKGFAVTLFLLGLCGIFYLPLLIYWSSNLLPDIEREVELARMFIPFSAYMIKPLVQSAFLFLLPSIIMGAGFPIVLQAWANHVHKVGRSTGTAYGANTIGAVAGGIVTGFILIPMLGLQFTMSVLALAEIWIAAFIWMLFTRSHKTVGRLWLPAAASVFTLVVVGMPYDLFDKVIKSNPMLPEQLELVAVREGVVTTVSLYRNPRENTLYLYTSGHRVAGDTYFWRSDQKMLGHFGVLLNSKAKKVLSVGFGSGESTACMALHKLERADCVEIAPEIVDLSLRFFGHINLGEKLNEKIRMIYMDVKNYIHLTNNKYDAIVNDSIHPKHFAENASLYSKEYFEDAKKHLNENGLFISWIPTYNVDPAPVINSIIGTMMEVFPHVTIWYMTPDPAQYFLVVGSEKEQLFSPAHMETELSKEGVRKSLSEININNSMDIMSCYIGDENDIKRFIKSYTVNSDMRPFIEFTTADRASGSSMFRQFFNCVRGDSVYEHIDWQGFSEEYKNRWLSAYARLHKASKYLLMSNSAESYIDDLECCMKGLAIISDNPALLNRRSRIEKDIFNDCEKMITTDRTDGALFEAERLLKIHPQSVVAWMIRSLCMQKKGEMEEALRAATMAAHLAPDTADSHFTLGSIMYDAGKLSPAISEYAEALRLCEKPQKFAIYSRDIIMETVTKAFAVHIGHEKAKAASEIGILGLSTGFTEVAEDIPRELDITR